MYSLHTHSRVTSTHYTDTQIHAHSFVVHVGSLCLIGITDISHMSSRHTRSATCRRNPVGKYGCDTGLSPYVVSRRASRNLQEPSSLRHCLQQLASLSTACCITVYNMLRHCLRQVASCLGVSSITGTK